MATRFPFRFGKVTITQLSVVYARVYLESERGKVIEGISASVLSPQWFDKRAEKSAEAKEADLIYSLTQAAKAYVDSGFGSAFDLHGSAAAPVARQLVGEGVARLAAGFGPAILDAAIADGICRFLEKPFCHALRYAFGLAEEDAAVLPKKPVESIRFRHTIGLADALRTADIEDPLQDGLPEALEEVVDFYQPALFKIKISADIAETLPRLRQISEVLGARLPEYSLTLDGNEQFADMGAFRDFLEQIRNRPEMSGLLSRLLWIEQPVKRETALESAVAQDLAEIARFKPVIIDESDEDDNALNRALALGYSGVSSKLCKGMFRSVSHYLELHRLKAAGRKELILSSEDLTTVPLHALQQDLCLSAALALTHSERNGHHYIRSFDFMTEAEQEDALRHYPSFYDVDAGGRAKVRISDGAFKLGEINSAPGFGSRSFPDWAALQTVE